ncbi:TPA: hypothetical protein ACH3X1_014634 [Trebouxia sp. C0004]
MSIRDLDRLEAAMLKVLAELEELLPAWELDMNRHKMIHLVKAIRTNGPCWAWAMFGFEHYWKVMACSCCDKSYDELWSKFLADTSTTKPTRAQLPNVLQQWHAWANQQPDLCEHAQRLCYGSRCQVTMYDRAQIGGASFSAMTTEGKKHSRNSAVLMKDDDVYWAGRVRFYLTHTLPGYDVGDVEEACIAHVHWYKKVPRRDQIDPIVGCPVFQEGFKDDPNGNMWPMAPVTLTVARHRKSGWVCVFNRCGNFLDHVP